MADYRPQIPAYDRDLPIFTYEDVVEHLLDFFRIERADDRHMRQARRAIDISYRDLPFHTRWSYYDRVAIIHTEASQSTGTIAYDHTGGTYERQLTLTGATWPDNARHYKVIIGDTHYRVEDKKSTTVVTLEQSSNPGADVASGTTYQTYRSAYPLPIDFRKAGRVYNVDNEHELKIVTNDTQHSQAIFFYDSPGTPWTAAIRSTGEFFGQLELVLSPPPSAAESYSIIYEASPFPLITDRYIGDAKSGTVTTDGTTTVEGASTTFDSLKHTGCILRVSGNTEHVPTSTFGRREDNLLNPYKYQRVIMSVTDSDTLEVDTLIPTLTTVKFSISSPVDIEPGAMYTAFIRMCEAEFARNTDQKDRQEHEMKSMQALRFAMENDQRASQASGGVRYYDKFRRAIVTTDT